MPNAILAVHNFYQGPGGEDVVFATEAAMLERKGHRVIRYEDRNERIGGGMVNGVASGMAAVWNQGSYVRVQRLAREHRPDVAHFHNTFPLISPAAYYAARREGVAVVQTLHNYRLLCPGGNFLRDGRVCEECVERRSLAPAIAHACYRGSRSGSAAVAAMLTVHRAVGTWRRMVDVYVAPSEFVRQKFIASGFAAERILVKPNTLAPNTLAPNTLTNDADADEADCAGDRRDCGVGYALFVGRLWEVKGIRTLAAAWKKLGDIPLLVAGEGPLSGIEWPAGVTRLGVQSRERVRELMRGARALVFPSVCYEGQPLTIIEAFASGLPVIGSALGGVRELIDDGRTGLLFRAGDAEDLAAKVRWAFAHCEEMDAMRVHARREYEAKFTAERNYGLLMEIYESAMERARARRGAVEARTAVAS